MAKRDVTLDKCVEELGTFYGEGENVDSAKMAVAVEVWAYNGEAPRVAIHRRMKQKNGWLQIKLDRLTAAEALAVANILQQNAAKLAELNRADAARHEAKVQAVRDKMAAKKAEKDAAKAQRAEEVQKRKDAKSAEVLAAKEAKAAAKKAASNSATA